MTSKTDTKQERKLVIPGETIVSGDDYLPGDFTRKEGKDIISTNFKPVTYEVENTLHLHTGAGDDLRILRGFEYDHTGRLIENTYKINSNDEVVLALLEYNEIGDLIAKYLHSDDEGSKKNFLQKTDYTYNIRGWLKSINNLSIDADNDVFGMLLYYEDVSEIDNLVSNGLYNGNISGAAWSIKNDIIRGYGYEYDTLNRLTDAHYADGGGLDQHEGYYSMEVPYYDYNGNIVSLKRYFNNILVDDLSYNYYGPVNQLQSVTDNGTASSQVDDYPGTSGYYDYDDNGNMDHDGGKNLDIGYNYLNLPEVVDFGGDNKLFYHYDAVGRKLVKYKDVSGGTDVVTHYIGDIVYSDSDIDYILTGEGRIVPYEGGEETRWLYEYYMKDHLGNTRAVFNGTNLGGNIDILQHSSYYPFGLVFDIEDYGSTALGSYSNNKYLYNSKELQDEMMQSKKLNWYDYGARMYDPQLGRWHVMDPKSEKYVNLSPYNYAANNPIIFVDRDGKEIYIITQNKDVVKATAVINQTSLGKNLWDKYANNANHDIYISSQSFNYSKGAGGITYAYANNLTGLIKNGKINFSQWYFNPKYSYLKDWSTFDKLDVSRSKGKNIHLVNMNEDKIAIDGTYNENKFNGGAQKIFHEINAHIDNYTNGNEDAEHEKHGYKVVTKEINGKKVEMASLKKGSDAWNMMIELIQQRQKEEQDDKNKEK